MRHASAWMLVLVVGMGLLAGCQEKTEDCDGCDITAEGDMALEPYPVSQIPDAEPQPTAGAPVDGSSTTVVVTQMPRDNYAPAPSQAGKTYVVKKGDSLYSISRQVYGTAAKHRVIYNANKDVLTQGPDVLQVGMTLVLP